MEIWIWTAIIVVSLVIEFFTAGELVSVWFSVAGVISLILHALGASNLAQIIVFIIVSLTLIVLLRPICVKFLNRNKETTNTDTMINQNVKLLTDIKLDEVGTAKFNGIIWNCITIDNTEIPSNSIVQIVEIKGNKLIVKKI